MCKEVHRRHVSIDRNRLKSREWCQPMIDVRERRRPAWLQIQRRKPIQKNGRRPRLSSRQHPLVEPLPDRMFRLRVIHEARCLLLPVYHKTPPCSGAYIADSPRRFQPQIVEPSILLPSGPGQCVSRLREPRYPSATSAAICPFQSTCREPTGPHTGL